DRVGNGAAGAQLRVVALSGSVRETLLVADRMGRVPVAWTLGRAAGTQWLELRAGRDSAVRVSARARPLEPANITAAGLPSAAPAGRALSKPVTLTVTDAYGNPISDVQVVVNASAGSATPVRVMTDLHGHATTRWTLATVAGDQNLTAPVRGTPVRTTAA